MSGNHITQHPEYIVANLNTFRVLMSGFMAAMAVTGEAPRCNLGVCPGLPDGYILSAFEGQLHITNAQDPMFQVYTDDVDEELRLVIK